MWMHYQRSRKASEAEDVLVSEFESFVLNECGRKMMMFLQLERLAEDKVHNNNYICLCGT